MQKTTLGILIGLAVASVEFVLCWNNWQPLVVPNSNPQFTAAFSAHIATGKSLVPVV